MVTAHALAFGGLLLLGGRIADYAGRKRVFVVDLAGLAIASLIMVVVPGLVSLFGLWIAVAALRSGLVLDHGHLVNLPYAGIRRSVLVADIAGVGTSFGSNFTAPTVTLSSGKVLLLTGVACSPTEHSYFRSRSIAQQIAVQLAIPYEEGN